MAGPSKSLKFPVCTVIAVLALQLSVVSPYSAVASPEENNEDAVRLTLRNGLRVVVVPDQLAPVVTTVVNYLVGSNEAPPGFPGMAHAQEHMMFRGSPVLSANQLAAISAAMGGQFDADTQQTVTQYFFTVPKKDIMWRFTLNLCACRVCSTRIRCGTRSERRSNRRWRRTSQTRIRLLYKAAGCRLPGYALRT